MGNVARIGDDISCGDHIKSGSGNVFANGMPVTTQASKSTLGHECFPPTDLAGPWSSTVFVNNAPVAIKGKTQIVIHKCGKKWHGGTVSSGAGTVSIEDRNQ